MPCRDFLQISLTGFGIVCVVFGSNLFFFFASAEPRPMIVAASPEDPTTDHDALDWSEGRLPQDHLLLAELRFRPALQLLELHSNSLGCAGVSALVQALRSPGCAGSLRYLGLARNAISEAGGCSIAAWLATASAPLQTLDLQDNSLGDRAATAFASTLQRNRQLQVTLPMRSGCTRDRAAPRPLPQRAPCHNHECLCTSPCCAASLSAPQCHRPSRRASAGRVSG